MGRAIGLFLLVVGLGIAAYGLPASDTGWTVAAPSATKGESAGLGAGLDDRTTVPGAAERGGSPTREPLARKAAPSASNASATLPSRSAGASPASSGAGAAIGMAPMDKLRAAAATRNQATSPDVVAREPVGSMQPLSQRGGIATLPPVPKPVEVLAASRPQLPVPSVITKARREATQPAPEPAGAAGGKGALASKSGWSTTVAATPSANSAHRGAESAHAQVAPAPTRTTTLSIATGPKQDTAQTRDASARDGMASIGTKTARVAVDEKVGAAPAASLAGAQDVTTNAAADKALARVQPEQRTRVAQRHTPPVYLGRSPSYVPSYVPTYSSGDSGSAKRKFRTQEFWENSHRNGS